MFRQSPSRNQRSKGIKVKHVLQICMLLAICFWLIYQVKHSHDKKKEFDENGAKLPLATQNHDENLRWGRKELHPHVQETATSTKKHEEEEVEEIGRGVAGEVSKHEEEEQEEEEEENKNDEREDEERGGGDDEIDELDQEKSEGEADREEDFIDEEKEREEDDEKEIGEKDDEEKEDQFDNENSAEDQDHDRGGRNTHEAREEHYRGDDASSEVAHDNQIITTEVEKENSENTNENAEILEQENKSNKTEENGAHQNNSLSKVGEGEMAENGTSSNATTNEEKSNEAILPKLEDKSLLNPTIRTESDDQSQRNNSTEVGSETSGAALQGGAVTMLDTTEPQNATVEGPTTGEHSNLQTVVLERVNNSDTTSDGNISDSNATISSKTEDTDTTMGGSSNFSSNSENAGAVQKEKSKPTEGTGSKDESLDASSSNENANAVQQDPVDSSNSSILQEEKEVLTDLDTLPEIRTEGSNSEDAAAE